MTTTSRENESAIGCLSCHAPAPADRSSRWHCVRCGASNSAAEIRADWTRHPVIVSLQKGLVALLWGLPVVAFVFGAVFSSTFGDAAAALVSGGAAMAIVCLAPIAMARGLRRRDRSRIAIVAVGASLVWVASFGIAFANDRAATPALVVMAIWILVVSATVVLWAAPRPRLIARLRELDARRPVVESGRRSESASPRLPRYCLHCFSHDVEDRNGTFVCGDCGEASRPVDRRRFWNLNPEFARIEWTLKSVALAISLLVSVAIFVSNGTGYGVNQGWFLALGPIAFTVVAWLGASKFRRHLYAFSGSLVWAVAVAILGLASLPALAAAGFPPRLVAFAAVAVGLAAWGVGSLGRSFAAMRARRIREGRRRVFLERQAL